MSLVYNTNTRTTSNNKGVTTSIPGAPPAGTTEDVEYLDSGSLLNDYTPYIKYYADIVNELHTHHGYNKGHDLHGAPYDFRRAANEQKNYFTELRNLIQSTYVLVS